MFSRPNVDAGFIYFVGPISVAIYVEKSNSTTELMDNVQSLLGARKNVAVHLVAEKGVSYSRGVLNAAAATAITLQ